MSPTYSAALAETVSSLITDANLLVAAAVAFVAGVVSFASPCVVPLVPGYLSYVTGLSGQDIAGATGRTRGRVLAGSLLFVAGFAVPFTMIGVAFGALSFLQRNLAVRITMGVVVAGLGLLMASGRLLREWRITDHAPATGIAAAPALGFVFGVGWTPCIGPALAAILGLSVNAGDELRGGVLAFVFALGIGLPFVLVAVAFRRMSGALAFLRRNARRLQVLGGAMLVLVGVAIATGWWDAFIRWIRPLIVSFEPPL